MFFPSTVLGQILFYYILFTFLYSFWGGSHWIFLLPCFYSSTSDLKNFFIVLFFIASGFVYSLVVVLVFITLFLPSKPW